MNRLFNRQIAVTLSRPQAGSFFALQSAETITIRDLRMMFSIEKHLKKEPNNCSIKIYNLNQNSRAIFQQKPVHVLIETGYDDEHKRLFSGDVRWAISRHEGPEWSTEIELGDGERAYANARVERSYREGIQSKDLLAEIAKAMGLEVPKNAREATFLRKEFASGLSLSGSASRELTKLLDRFGLNWSIQDGRLQILGANDARNEEPFIIAKEKGMIGAPEYGAPAKGERTPTLKLKSLLYPELQPGGRIQVISSAINGVFRIERLVHTGDTHGSDWYTDIEAKPFSGGGGELEES